MQGGFSLSKVDVKKANMKENLSLSTVFSQVTHTKFHRNPFSASRFITCVRTDGRTEVLISAPNGYERVKNDTITSVV
jgi:hypothetical protein